MPEERLFSTEVFVLVTQNQSILVLYLELVRESRILNNIEKNISSLLMLRGKKAFLNVN